MKPVESSNISHVGHEGDTLTIRFKSGATWNYHGVSARTHDELVNADSIGSYFARRIKPHYKGTKHEG